MTYTPTFLVFLPSNFSLIINKTIKQSSKISQKSCEKKSDNIRYCINSSLLFLSRSV